MPHLRWIGILCLCLSCGNFLLAQEPADLILHNGKIITVDAEFSVAQAIALQGDRILSVGTDDDLLKLNGPETKTLDLDGRTVLPGLIDSHVHATGASLYEFDHPVPEMETISDVLAYVQSRAEALEEVKAIQVHQTYLGGKQVYATKSTATPD